jgi:hypothetical protein
MPEILKIGYRDEQLASCLHPPKQVEQHGFHFAYGLQVRIGIPHATYQGPFFMPFRYVYPEIAFPEKQGIRIHPFGFCKHMRRQVHAGALMPGEPA